MGLLPHQDKPAVTGAARAITARSVMLGSCLIAVVSGLGPYNDFVVQNGFLIASYLPVIYVLAMFLLTVAVNAPLRKWRPRWALSGGELAIVALMLLTACAIPCQGLLRSFLPELVHPFYHGQFAHQFWGAFTAMGLPRWLFPVQSLATGRSSDVVNWFYTKAPDGQSIPYRAWIIPIAGWGVFLVCLFIAVVAGSMLLYPQWAVNERLPFPIAQVELSLIAQPAGPSILNTILGSKMFWIGLGIAFVIQNQSALHAYFPKQMPAIPLDYDFTRLMTAEPWIYLAPAVKKNAIVFLYVAMGFFVQGRVGFSVFFIYLALQVVIMIQQMALQWTMPGDALIDQHLGASLAYMGGVFWVGRHQWKKTLSQKNSRGRSLAIWMSTGVVGMLIWLKVLGVGSAMAFLIVGFILLTHAVTARVVAETGLPMFRSYATAAQVYSRFNPAFFSGRDVYFAQFFSCVGGGFCTRESVAVFVQHGLWIFNRSEPDRQEPPSQRGLGLVIGYALLLSFIIGTGASLHCYYSYARPISRQINAQFINARGQEDLPTKTIADPLEQFSRGRFKEISWNPKTHLAVGAGIAGMLSFCSLRISGWPLMPVGYILATTPFVDWVWYSMMIGWITKVLVLRFGGSQLFQQARPLFIGLIVGEALAAAVWIVINITLASTGHDYHPILMYPS